MRRFTIISFSSVDIGSHLEFDQILPSQSKRIVGVSVYSAQYRSEETKAANLKVSLMTNNQQVFNGNPVFCLGTPSSLHKHNPSWVEVDQMIVNGKNLITGHIEIMTNPFGNPFDLDLIIKTE